MKQTNENLKATKMLTDMQAIQSGATTSNIAADTRLKDAMLGEAKKKEAVADIDKAYYDTTFGHYFRKYIGNTAAEIGRVLGGGNAPVGKVTIPGQ